MTKKLQEQKRIEEENEAGDIYKVKDVTSIESGSHLAEIVDVKRVKRKDRETSKEYDYTDIIFKIDGSDYDIKHGFPSVISKQTGLGKFLTKSNLIYNADDKFTLDAIKKHLIGKKVNFQTITNADGFAEIHPGSFKFL